MPDSTSSLCSSASESLRGFSAEKTFANPNKCVYIGRLNDLPAVLELYPACSTDFEGVLKLRHATVHHNDVYYTGEFAQLGAYTYSLICPASVSDISAASAAFEYVRETYDQYLKRRITRCECAWADEKKRLFDDDILTLYDASSSSNFLWAIYLADQSILSIREVNGASLLKTVRKRVYARLSESDVDCSNICIYFYVNRMKCRLCLYVGDTIRTPLMFRNDQTVALLDTAIKNLEIDPDYYKKDLFYLQAPQDEKAASALSSGILSTHERI